MRFIKRYWRIIFPIFFILLIWAFSATTGDSSNATSLGVANAFGLSNLVARKLAHIVLFGALGYSFSSFIKGLHPFLFPNYTIIVYCLILTTIYGAIDEVHQLTVAGRSGTINDVFLDTIAGLGGILLYTVIFCFFRLWRIRHAKIY